MNQKRLMRVMIVVIAAMLLGNFASRRVASPIGDDQDTPGLIRDCPEHWYIDRMPVYGDPPGSEGYFVYHGMRRELAEFDVPWVQKYCSIVPISVY